MSEPTHRFHRMLREAQRFEYTFRKNVETLYNYYDGEQWTEAERAEIEARGQQATVLNIIYPTLEMLRAIECQHPSDVQVVGREGSDDTRARVMTELLKQMIQSSDFDYYDAEAFKDALIVGRGWAGAGIQKDEYGKWQVFAEQIPFEEIYMDPYSRKRDGSDARYMIRLKYIDRDELKALYPKKADEIDSVFNDSYHGVEYEAGKVDSDRPFDNGYYDHRSARCAVCECFYTKPTPEVDKGKTSVKMKFHRVVFSDEVILFGDAEDDTKNVNYLKVECFPWVPFYASKTRKGLPCGVVSRLKDLQDQINKMNSKFIWNISANRVVMEEDTATSPDEVHEQSQKPDGLIVLKSGGFGKFQLEQNLRDLSFISGHVNFMLSMCQRISGVNDSMLGFGGVNERSGVIQQNRIAQGATMQTSLLDNVFFSKRQLAKVMLRLAGEWYNDERIVRVTNETEDVQELRFNMPDPENPKNILNPIEDALKFDVVFKRAPVYSSSRDRTLQLFSEVFKSGVVPPPIAAKLMIMLSEDIPDKQKILGEIEQFYAQQAQIAQAQAQAQAKGQSASAVG